MSDKRDAPSQIEFFQKVTRAISAGMERVIIGQTEVVRGVLTCLFSGGHVLIEGVPGLGKTVLVRTLADLLHLPFSRIQFTPDLMPTDILGTTALVGSAESVQRLEFQPGPVFGSIILADEVNRATPKTQSALLEAMAERRVTINGVTHDLGQPYFVLATQNPLDMEGTYPLPEAQLDRFLMKLSVPFPSAEELHQILARTTSAPSNADDIAGTRITREDVLAMQGIVRELPVSRPILDLVVRLVRASHPDLPEAPESVRRFVVSGASPRGAQGLVLAAKVRALLDGRATPNFEDVLSVAGPVLRHRIRLNFDGEAEGLQADGLIELLLEHVGIRRQR